MFGNFLNKLLGILAGIAALAAGVFALMFRHKKAQLEDAEQTIAQGESRAKLRDDIDDAQASLTDAHKAQRRSDDEAIARGDRDHLDREW